MVYKIIRNEKFKVFFESLIITILILMIGFLIGFYVESSRTNSIVNQDKQFQISALDLGLQNYYFQIIDSGSCKTAIDQNLAFADRIYNTGLQIQQYEQANQLSQDILLEKKRYVLLQDELWLNSILLKQKCNNPFHTVVYIYAQNTNTAKDAEQAAISDTLRQIKEEKGNSIILIPIAGDLGLDTINMQMATYNITSLPSVLIDEKTVLSGYYNKTEIEKYLN